jgi:ABC-type Fe3+/spermidine/putrescine transport system ATPase subunit
VIETALGRIEVPSGIDVGGSVTVAIRPEHVRVDGSGAIALGEARVRDRHFYGTYQRCHLEVDEVELLVFAPATLPIEEGAAVRLSVDPADVVLLDGPSGPQGS